MIKWHDPVSNLLLSPIDPKNQPNFTVSLLSEKGLIKDFSNKNFGYFEAKRLMRFLKKNYPNLEIENIRT